MTEARLHKWNKITTWVYKLLLLSCAIFILTIPFTSHTTSLIVRVPTVMLMMSIGFIYLTCYSFRISDLFFIGTISMIILISFLYNPQNATLENIYHNVSFIAFILLISSASIVPVSKNLLRFIYFLATSMSLLLFFYSFTSVAHFDGKRYVDLLTLGFNNSNLTGMILFLIAALVLITRHSVRMQFPALIVFGLLLWLEIQTGSRTSLFSMIYLAIFSIYKPTKSFPTILIWGLVLFSLCFVPAYLWLYEHYPNFVLLGKPFFSGREETFLLAFQYYYNSSLLAGNASLFAFENAHNSPLSILITIGVLGLFSFYFILLRHLLRLNRQITNPISGMSVLVLLACILNSCAEGACFNGSFPIAIFVYTFFILANNSAKERRSQL